MRIVKSPAAEECRFYIGPSFGLYCVMPSSSETPTTPTCPTCGETTRQHRAGANPSGTARRECQHCKRTYTPEPKTHGYELEMHRQALKLYVDGMNFRRIARHLSVNHQTVINWVDQAAAKLPVPPLPKERKKQEQIEPKKETLELDELYTFVSQKKSQRTSSPV